MGHTVAIRGGRVIDPANKVDRLADVLIEDGRIKQVGERLTGDETVDAGGRLVTPGLIDTHVHLRDPGNPEEETIATGSAAAIRGGFTTICVMPDTDPPIDGQDTAEFVMLLGERAAHARIRPLGAITKGRQGETLAELGSLAQAGVVAFTDDRTPDAEIMRAALSYARMLGKPVISRPEDPALARGGIVRESAVSALLGLPAIPAVAEEIIVDRDIRLAALTGGHVHLSLISTQGAVDIIRRARTGRARVTASVAVHHLVLTDEALRSFDTNLRVNPPLGTAADADALLSGLADGTIDALVSDHSPRSDEGKEQDFMTAPDGAIGLETAVALVFTRLIHTGRLDLSRAIHAWTAGPARALGLEGLGALTPGAAGDVTVIDPEKEWVIDREQFASRSRNCPFHGWKVKGKPVAAVAGGKVFLNP
jgi:dihydroorotase